MEIRPAAHSPGKKSLRLLAWAFHPEVDREPPRDPGGFSRRVVRIHPVHSCRDTCLGSNGGWREETRQDKRCCLPGYDGPWSPDPPRDHEWLIWLGLPQRRPLATLPREQVEKQIFNGSWKHPSEDIEDGCPGGWSRSRYADSFSKYRRRRVESGMHDQNPLVHAGTDPRVLEALRYFEDEESSAWNYIQGVINGQ